MTKLFPFKAIMLVLLFAASNSSIKAQLLTEDFNYTAGTLLTANGWAAHSGAGTNAITVTAPSLVYAGHPGSGIGNAISMTTTGEDANKAFTAITTGTAYSSFLVNVSAAQATGDYFAGLFQNISSFPVRVYVKSSGAGFVFGIGKNAGTAAYEATVRSFGTTYLIATNYIYNAGAQDDAVNLWVNPTLGAAEPAATIANVTAANADATTIGAFYARQGTAANASTQRVDAILVGTTWASVTPGAVISTVSVSAGANAAEPATNGTFLLTLSAPAPAGDVTVTYTLTGTAGSSDYTDPLAGTITIAEGNTSGTITLNVIDDPDFEGTETINITLNTASNGYAIGTGTASINLLDNDAPPSVSVAAGVSAAEPATNGTFIITLSTAAPVGGITVTYTLTGTALINQDYTDPQAGTVTISQGGTSAVVTMNILNDPDPESPETIIITLNTATSPYVILGPTATINVTSDDFALIPLTMGTPYTQDFNTLANTGTTNALAIPGWLMNETGGGARDNELYAADNGGSNTGDTYSYGAAATTERAFGSLQSGTLISSIGSGYVNNTGVTITKLRVMYTGEQWRLGAIGRNDRLDFQYSTDASSITTGTWVDVNSLDFIAPNSTGTVGALNGNLGTNQVAVAFDITALSIPAGASFYIRWNSSDASGADDGVAVDNFSIEANPADLTPPSILTLTPSNGATNISINTNASIVFNEPVQKVAGTITVRKTIDNSILQTINIISPTVVVADASVSFFLNGLAANTGYYIEISNGALEDLSGNDFAGISGSGTWSFTTGTNFYVANFNGCSSSLTEGFSQYSETGAIVWACTSFGRDPAAPAGNAPFPFGVQINGFSGGTNVPNVDWLISPGFDLTGTIYPLLSFWSRTAFNGLPLQLKVSMDYTGGNPLLATWTDVNGKFPGQTSNIWTLSQDINLSAFKQPNVHFAFVYTSSDDDGARWTLDDISLVNSDTPPPPSLTVPTTDIQFTYVASGATASKTFTFIGNDLTDDVSVTSTGVFELSKDGISFSPSLTYTVAEANNITKTVYVRFAPTQNGQDYSGTATVSTGSLSSLINLRGTSIDPATTLEVVNWNIEWFGSTAEGPTNEALQEQNVSTILESVGADVYGLVEVVSEERLASVVSQMPGYAYVISNYGSHTNTSANPPGALAAAQKLAFIYKTSVLGNISTMPLLSQGINSAADLTNPAYNYWASGRFPYMMSADVTLNCVTKNVKFILVHGKANTSPTATSYERRKKGADSLNFLLNQSYVNDNIIILGDYNDDLDQSITAGFIITSWSAFTNDVANFEPVTLPLSLAGKKSTVSYNDVIDHVIISNELEPYYMPATANILTDVSSLVTNYGSTTSDHYPVFTRYRFANTVAPSVVSCTKEVTFCSNNSNSYSIPAFVATDDCGDVVEYSYTITGATSRSGTSNDASGAFNVGTSVITWTATDSWGNSSTCETTVIINPSPSVTIPDAFALPSGVLANTVYIGYTPASSLTLTAVASGGTPGYLYNWSSGSTVATTTVSPVVATIYSVTITDANSCTVIASKTVNVIDIQGGNKNDKVIICHNSNTIVVDGNSVITHLAHGDMLASCNSNSSRMITLAEKTIPAKLSAQALPNPSGSHFTLLLQGDETNGFISLKVTDVQGRIVEQKQNLRPEQTLRIGQRYQPGMYFAEIMQGKEKFVVKLVKLD